MGIESLGNRYGVLNFIKLLQKEVLDLCDKEAVALVKNATVLDSETIVEWENHKLDYVTLEVNIGVSRNKEDKTIIMNTQLLTPKNVNTDYFIKLIIGIMSQRYKGMFFNIENGEFKPTRLYSEVVKSTVSITFSKDTFNAYSDVLGSRYIR